MSRANTVGIVGAGPFGTALAQVVASRDRSVVLWSQTTAVVDEINQSHTNRDRLPGIELSASIRATASPAELASQCRLIVVAVNSDEVRQRAHVLGAHTDGSHLVVHAIGGLAAPDLVPVTDVLVDELPTLEVGALAGPALAADLAAGRVSSMVCASRFDTVSSEVKRLLSAPPILRIYKSSDLVGVELASALAGAYTTVVGLADALEVGAGTRAVLVTRIVAEMARLGDAVGASPRTFFGLAGLGNILLRSSPAASEGSTEYQLGLALARGETPAALERCEGVRATRAGMRLAQAKNERVPVLGALAGILAGEISPAEARSGIAATVAGVE